MKIVRFDLGDGRPRCGYIDGDAVVESATDNPLEVPAAHSLDRYQLDSVRLLSPILRPRKFLAVGLNYPLHVGEAGFETPTFPRIFNKQTTCLAGPGDGVQLNPSLPTLDYEGELGVVIGEYCRNVSEDEAPGVVAGYVALNDITIRQVQIRSPTITLAKSGDTHGPVGPWLVTPDEIADPGSLNIRTFVDEEKVQDFNTSDMIFSIPHLISVISGLFTLEPGDLIATGTGEGVGAASKPMRWLRSGQTVTVVIDGLGSLANPVVEMADKAEPVRIPVV